MRIELNIGLNVANGDNSEDLRTNRGTSAYRQLSRWAQYGRYAQSSTEETLVVVCSVPVEEVDEFNQVVFELAMDLQQDCIAAYNAAACSGALIGPNTAAWGEFNPEFFIRFDEADGPAQIYTPVKTAAMGYTGHGARTGGLQAHSMGDEYPYIIHGITTGPHAPTEYQVMDSRTGNTSQRFPTYLSAHIHYTSLRVRNLMHS